MKIWVDADAAPRAVKQVLFRAAERTGVEVVLVANQTIAVPRHLPHVTCVVVGKGFDVADELIEEQAEPGDLVITQDVPLAAAAVERGADVIDIRGEVIDESNARARLAARDRREEIRLSGELMGGPPPYGERDKRRFANALDRWLTRALRA